MPTLMTTGNRRERMLSLFLAQGYRRGEVCPGAETSHHTVEGSSLIQKGGTVGGVSLVNKVPCACTR
jgi:hypothetical protein